MTDLRTAAQQALEALLLCDSKDAGKAMAAITALSAALEQPEPPPEAQTEAEKIAYCAGWWAAMEQKREQPEQEPISQLKPNATTRLQDPGAYDRGVLTGLRQALAICSDWEDWTADRLAGDIQDAINNQMALEQPEQQAEPVLLQCTTCGTVYADGVPPQVPEQEPVATVAMDVSRAHISWDGKYLGQRPDMKIAMLLKDLPVGTLLFTHPPRREWRGLSEEEIQSVIQLEREKRFQRRPPLPLSMTELSHAIEAKLKEKNT